MKYIGNWRKGVVATGILALTSLISPFNSAELNNSLISDYLFSNDAHALSIELKPISGDEHIDLILPKDSNELYQSDILLSDPRINDGIIFDDYNLIRFQDFEPAKDSLESLLKTYNEVNRYWGFDIIAADEFLPPLDDIIYMNRSLLPGNLTAGFAFSKNADEENIWGYVMYANNIMGNEYVPLIAVPHDMNIPELATMNYSLSGLEPWVVYSFELIAVGCNKLKSVPTHKISFAFSDTNKFVSNYLDFNGDKFKDYMDLLEAYGVRFGGKTLFDGIKHNAYNGESIESLDVEGLHTIVRDQWTLNGKLTLYGNADDYCGPEDKGNEIDGRDEELLQRAINGDMNARSRICYLNLGPGLFDNYLGELQNAKDYVTLLIDTYRLFTKIGDYNGDRRITIEDLNLGLGFLDGTVPLSDIWISNTLNGEYPTEEGIRYLRNYLGITEPPIIVEKSPILMLMTPVLIQNGLKLQYKDMTKK